MVCFYVDSTFVDQLNEFSLTYCTFNIKAILYQCIGLRSRWSVYYFWKSFFLFRKIHVMRKRRYVMCNCERVLMEIGYLRSVCVYRHLQWYFSQMMTYIDIRVTKKGKYTESYTIIFWQICLNYPNITYPFDITSHQ